MVKESELSLIICSGVDVFSSSNGTTLNSLKRPNLSRLQSGNSGENVYCFLFFSPPLALRTSCLYNDPEMSSMEKE